MREYHSLKKRISEIQLLRIDTRLHRSLACTSADVTSIAVLTVFRSRTSSIY